MHVEDALENLLILKHAKGLFTKLHRDEWTSDFIENVSAYTRAGKPLSTMQSKMILQILKRVEDIVCDAQFGARLFSIDSINALIKSPTYRQNPYPSADIPREVRWLGDNKVGLRFKKNPKMINDIKALSKSASDAPWFHRSYRVWIVPVTESTLEPLLDLISEHRFHVDEETQGYLETVLRMSAEKSQVVFDPDLNVFVAQINNDDVAAWWIETVLGATVE
jgi:hypothetical protein